MIAVWLQLPQAGRRVSVEDVERMALLAEERGFDGVWVGDHLALPSASTSVYPLRAEGLPLDPSTPFLEAYTALAYIAGITKHLRLATAVAVAPLRPAILLAKVAATLDVLSRGRVEIGLAPGWHAEELGLFGVDFARRGEITDEILSALELLWTGNEVSYHGAHVSFKGVSCRPTPMQLPGPPIWIGGHGRAALRRAARWGRRWMAAGLSAEELLAGRAAIEQLSGGLSARVSAQVAVHAAHPPPGPLSVCLSCGGGVAEIVRARLDVACLDVSAVPWAERAAAAVAALELVHTHSTKGAT